MIQILDYTLPDIALVDSIETKFLLWIPDKMYIVLGASNYIEDAVFKDVVEKDNIPIIKRKTGGQTVILTPNTLVISAIITDETILKPKDVFNRFNDLIIGIIEKDHTNFRHRYRWKKNIRFFNVSRQGQFVLSCCS